MSICTPSDEALALLFYVNNFKKWTRKHNHYDNQDHKCHTSRSGGIFSDNKGKGRFRQGWSKEGMEL